MSGTLPAYEPEVLHAESDAVELLIDARPRSLDGFTVRRVLPAARRRLVGPFIFFDHMGPAQLAPGVGFDVRPHPHIGLATLTYLFDGEIVHRDSLGFEQPIRPGDVNWMLAGRGVVHSERSSPEARRTGISLHGIQCWVALPSEQEEHEPRFEHHPVASLPSLRRGEALVDVLAGRAFGHTSPVGVLSDTLYVHARLEANARFVLEAEHEERAVYVADGAIGCDARAFREGTLVVLRPGKPVEIAALEAARLMILGGEKLAGERHVYWNFVSSSKERIEQAKDDWREGRFPKVPGDETEFTPLPEPQRPLNV